ncbi:MAG: hypothetical protein L0Y62_05450 [Nitrospirae bacterium]|nr:hypothetical protein [Nitrospirota bacterium]
MLITNTVKETFKINIRDLCQAVHPRLPDPDRSSKNIEAFLSQNPDYAESLKKNLSDAAALFSHSQFLANHCIKNPHILFDSLLSLNPKTAVDE